MRTEKFGHERNEKSEMRPSKSRKAALRPEKSKQKNSWKRNFEFEDDYEPDDFESNFSNYSDEI